MSLFAYRVWTKRKGYEPLVRTFKEARGMSRRELGLAAPNARPFHEKVIKEIDANADKVFRKNHQEISADVELARKELLTKRPVAVALQAAFDRPDRAVAMLQLAEKLSKPQLLGLARIASKQQDGTAAWAIRQAAGGLIEKGEDVTDIAAELNKVGRVEYGSALADLVGAQKELSLFEAAGPYADAEEGLLSDPLSALSAANRVGVIPTDEEGGTATLTPSEVEAMCETAGVSVTKTRAA